MGRGLDLQLTLLCLEVHVVFVADRGLFHVGLHLIDLFETRSPELIISALRYFQSWRYGCDVARALVRFCSRFERPRLQIGLAPLTPLASWLRRSAATSAIDLILLALVCSLQVGVEGRARVLHRGLPSDRSCSLSVQVEIIEVHVILIYNESKPSKQENGQ